MRFSLVIFLLFTFIFAQNRAQISTLEQATAKQTEILAAWTIGLTKTAPVPRYGYPSVLLTFTPNALPILQTSTMMGGTYGAAYEAVGRIAALGESSYYTRDETIRRNIRNWAGKGEILDSDILSLDSTNEESLLSIDLSVYKVLVWTSARDYKSEAVLNKIESFIRGGGGLIAAYAGWIWTNYDGFAKETDVSMNKILLRFGIINTFSIISNSNIAPTYVPQAVNINSYYAIASFPSGLFMDIRIFSVSASMDHIPIEYLNTVPLYATYFNNITSNIVFPLHKSKNKTLRLKAMYISNVYASLDSPQALPGLGSVPGSVSSSERLTVEFTAVREVSDSWISTGNKNIK
jgi:hypothetical protein